MLKYLVLKGNKFKKKNSYWSSSFILRLKYIGQMVQHFWLILIQIENIYVFLIFKLIIKNTFNIK